MSIKNNYRSNFTNGWLLIPNMHKNVVDNIYCARRYKLSMS